MDRGTGILIHVYGIEGTLEANLLYTPYPGPGLSCQYPRNQETINPFPRDVND